MSIPSHTLRRTRLPSCSCSATSTTQTRQASFLRRPLRPYTFTQLVVLSDGSSFTTRTTSPAPLYKSTKDTRNHIMWQPSMGSLRNIEEDEAGRLRAFRSRFGRGWDAETTVEDLETANESEDGDAGELGDEGGKKGRRVVNEDEMSLMDLISGQFQGDVTSAREGETAAAEKKAAKKVAKKK